MKFKIELSSFQGHVICEEFILGNYLEQQKLSRPQLYLLTKDRGRL